MNKTAIKNFAVWARVTLIKAVTQKAFEYEVTEDGKNDPSQSSVNGQSLTAAEKSQRSQLIAHIDKSGFAQTMEEAAYTWFNRFIALRFMEVNNYLPSHTRVFSDEENNFKPEVLSNAVDLGIDGLDRELVLEMLENQENERLYKYIIITQCNALNEGLPEMFEQIGGWTELLFPRNLLRDDSVIAHMVSDIPEEDWKDQVQIIGWLYQYYNTEPKDKVFADLKKNIKIGADSIPAATQLFTPDWIVRYMVENSLGRVFSDKWAVVSGRCSEEERIEAQKAYAEKMGWKYFLPEAPQTDEVRSQLNSVHSSMAADPEKIRFIDPCMGSGHILVYAFDVLMDIYTACGWSERDAAKSILRNNLYGLDIDRRAYQLAYFSVMMKARQYNRRIISPENQPNLANFADVTGAQPELLDGKVRLFAEQFENADIYGSLMTISAPEGIDDELSDYIPTLGISMRQLDMMMKTYHILGQEYDVVCTNPPYMGGGGMDVSLSAFVKRYYPNTKSDLSTCFMEKCEKLCTENGYYTMINIPVWMFLSSYEKLRETILNNNSYSSMIHFGRGVFCSDFGTTAFVISKKHIPDYVGVYRRLFEKQGAVDSVEQKEKWFFEGMGYHTAKQENFSKIPGMPVAYWVSENFVNVFDVGKQLGDLIPVKKGMDTGDNDYFLKMWYEVNLLKIDFEHGSKKWIPYDKGGNFRKWYGNNEYVVNWENDGHELKNSKANLRSKHLYFKESITWNALSSADTCFRYSMYKGSFDSAGSSMFPMKNDMFYYLGIMNSSLIRDYLKIINPTLNYGAGSIALSPIIIRNDKKENVNALVEENVTLSKQDWDSFETSWDFERHPLV